jgi:hypothetical protein
LAKRRCDTEALERISSDARRGNPFQRLDRATELFGRIKIDPFRVLTSDNRAFLIQHIEKRHVIGHNLGLADEKYLRVASNEREGEIVSLLGKDVCRFASLAQQVIVEGIVASEKEFLPDSSILNPDLLV